VSVEIDSDAPHAEWLPLAAVGTESRSVICDRGTADDNPTKQMTAARLDGEDENGQGSRAGEVVQLAEQAGRAVSRPFLRVGLVRPQQTGCLRFGCCPVQ